MDFWVEFTRSGFGLVVFRRSIFFGGEWFERFGFLVNVVDFWVGFGFIWFGGVLEQIFFWGGELV